MSDLKDQTIALIGASQGLGLSVGQSLSNHYKSLILFDKKPIAEDIKTSFNPMCSLAYKKLDVTQISSMDAVFKNALSNKVNHLIYCVRAKVAASTETINEPQWDLDFSTNLKGAFFTTQKILPYLDTRNYGSTITFISSISSELIGNESVSYHTSKAGLNHLIRYLAVHLGPQKIRVNGLEPGFIVQNRHKQYYLSENNTEYRQLAESCLPLQRIGHDEDVIGPLHFLLSKESSFITGQLLTIDGGMSLQDQYYLVNKVSKNKL